MFALYVSEMLKPLASDVQGRAIEGAGRLPAEERPKELAAELVGRFSRGRDYRPRHEDGDGCFDIHFRWLPRTDVGPTSCCRRKTDAAERRM
jgi:hypothetical protein